MGSVTTELILTEKKKDFLPYFQLLDVATFLAKNICQAAVTLCSIGSLVTA